MSVYELLATGRYYGFIDFRIFNYLTFLHEISESAILMPVKQLIKQLLAAYSINGLILVFVT